MPADATPLVYVETNWIVACVVPHDEHHKTARALLARARNGDCELRVPASAILESKRTVGTAFTRLFNEVTRLQNSVAKAFRNGAAPLQQVSLALDSALQDPRVIDYLNQPIERERQHLLDDAKVRRFSAPLAEAQTMEDLHSQVRLEGVDVLDFYILAAILTDRARPEFSQRTALLLSSNKDDLAPNKKLAADFYTTRRMVFWHNFELDSALHHWKTEFPRGAVGAQ